MNYSKSVPTVLPDMVESTNTISGATAYEKCEATDNFAQYELTVIAPKTVLFQLFPWSRSNTALYEERDS